MRPAAGLLALLAAGAAGESDPEYAQWSARRSDDDLFTYVTRPDLRPSKLNIALKKKDRTAPGYIFVAPYDCLECNNVPVTTYSPQQMGPHIYTEDGELVWSGGDLLPGTKVFDFKALNISGEHHLSFIAPPDSSWQPYPDGVAMVLNASYHPVIQLGAKELGRGIDMHEFNVVNDGQSALIGLTHRREARASDNIEWKGDVLDCTFTEFDLRTKQRTFNWTAGDHIPFTESTNPPPTSKTGDKPWDWFQLNSIDKDKFGNYIISARATNTIYYVSPSGSIIWRLGGLQSSFTQDFNFSRQHHVRVQNQNEVDMVLSFFDNAADGSATWKPTSTSSSLKIVGLDLVKMNARQYHIHEREDGGLTETNAGSIQFLPNGGVFGGWGENGVMTEYINRGGQKLYEASFASRRFTNYRAYKMEFVGKPTTKPSIKGFVSTNSRGQPTTSLYVSWNGATEVTDWRFYSHGPEKDIEIGRVPKTGFETAFTAMGYHPIIFVEALDESDSTLANSSLVVTEIPASFHDVNDPMYTNSDSALTENLAGRTAVAFIAGLAVAIVWERFRVGKYNIHWGHGPPSWAARSLRWAEKRTV